MRLIDKRGIMDSLIQLIFNVRNGSESAFFELCEQYKPLLMSMANKHAAMCSDEDLKDDFLQEAKMAFYNAIIAFDTNQSAVSFGFYVKRCIRNRLVSCVRKVNSKKRRQSSQADKTESDGSPQESVIQYEITKEEVLSLAKDTLSVYELKIFNMYLSGLRAKEISAKLGKSEKSVNNAIYRIRSKLNIIKKKINGGT